MSTLTQLGYAVAVDRCRNFRQAARACAVSQPTLSMQIQKLEDELGVILFDRSRKPVVPTREGTVLLEQFRAVLREHDQIDDLVRSLQGRVAGPYRLGIIPTMAPTILPRFVPPFMAGHPEVELTVEELTTPEIIRRLRDETLDGGILATPLGLADIVEFRLCGEDLVVFHGPEAELALSDGGVAVGDLPTERLIVLSEGHCLRTQALDLCALNEAVHEVSRFHLEAGSVATLSAMVRSGPYFTILPALAARELEQQGLGALIKPIAGPVPFREIGLIVRRVGTRRAIREALFEAARSALQDLQPNRPRRAAPVRPVE